MLHQDEIYFPNALKFDPTRWLDPLEARRIDKAFVAFGKGTRGCVGLKCVERPLLSLPNTKEPFWPNMEKY